jgi:hypothetical protein
MKLVVRIIFIFKKKTGSTANWTKRWWNQALQQELSLT